MMIFLDTEFTASPYSIFGLYFRPKLISIGLVPEVGEPFYAETTMFNPRLCSGFVKRYVLPILTGPVLSPTDPGIRLIAFLAAQPAGSQIACDHAFDLELLIRTIRGVLPVTIQPGYFDLSPVKKESAFIEASDRYFSTGKTPHHALHDATAMSIGWRAAKDVDLAIQKFQNKELGLNRAAKASGLTLERFMDLLGERGVPVIDLNGAELDYEFRELE